MRIKTYSPVKNLEGSHAGSDIVYSTYAGRTIARWKPDVRRESTPDQKAVQALVASVTRSWSLISADQRSGWQQYAETYETTDAAGRPVVPNGLATYMGANLTRRILGLPVRPDAPVLAPPLPLTAFAPAVTENPTTFTFQVTHEIADVSGLSVLVKITPAMLRLSQTPDAGDAQLIRGLSPNSAAALVASGGQITFTDGERNIEDGQRYGYVAHVVRLADGVRSRAVVGDAIRLLA